MSEPCSSSQLRRDQERFQAASAWGAAGGRAGGDSCLCAAPAPCTAPAVSDTECGGRHVARGRAPARALVCEARSEGTLSLGSVPGAAEAQAPCRWGMHLCSAVCPSAVVPPFRETWIFSQACARSIDRNLPLLLVSLGAGRGGGWEDKSKCRYFM